MNRFVPFVLFYNNFSETCCWFSNTHARKSIFILFIFEVSRATNNLALLNQCFSFDFRLFFGCLHSHKLYSSRRYSESYTQQMKKILCILIEANENEIWFQRSFGLRFEEPHDLIAFSSVMVIRCWNREFYFSFAFQYSTINVAST